MASKTIEKELLEDLKPMVKDLREKLKCKKCHKLSERQHPMGRCNHLLCDKCLDLHKGKQCPFCSSAFDPKGATRVELWGTLVTYCRQLAHELDIEEDPMIEAAKHNDDKDDDEVVDEEPEVEESPPKRGRSAVKKAPLKATRASAARVSKPASKATPKATPQKSPIGDKRSPGKSASRSPAKAGAKKRVVEESGEEVEEGEIAVEKPSPRRQSKKTATVDSANGSTVRRSRSSSTGSKIHVLGTSLTEAQKQKLEEFATKFNVKIHTEFNEKVSHVVGNEPKPGLTIRTLKYMKALLANKWLLTFDWVDQSIKKKRLVEEDDFELKGTTKQSGSNLGMPRKSRETQKRLFDGIKVYFDGKFQGNESVPNKIELGILVTTGGGKVMPSNYSARSKRETGKIMVISENPKKAAANGLTCAIIDVKTFFTFIVDFNVDETLFSK